MPQFSAIVTCTTECEVRVEAENATEARYAIELGKFSRVSLHDGGLDMVERFQDIDIVDGSFGEDK